MNLISLICGTKSVPYFTVFAPDNAAFAAFLVLSGLTMEQILASPDLKTILANHVVQGKFSTADLIAMGLPDKLTTLGGALLKVETAVDGGVIVGGQRILRPNIESANGVIHSIGGVIMDWAHVDDPVEMNNTVDPSIAPTDSDDSGFRVESQSGPSAIVSIPQTLGASPDFLTLFAAVSAAELGATLAAEGPFTVFAPNNGAFATFLELSGLTFEQSQASPDLQMLLGLLLANHVIPG
jgi:uncharacterized surface protein with fasciclin (FAS1) repeats